MKADWGKETREYDKEFEKYKKGGVDLVYRCDRCGRRVFRANIQGFPHGCRKCGSTRVRPMMGDLTKFGILWCQFWNWYYAKRYFSYNRKIS